MAEPKLADEELAILRAIQEAPRDDATRMVYADWLEERGDPLGEFVRLHTALSATAEGGHLRLPAQESDEPADRLRQLAARHGDQW